MNNYTDARRLVGVVRGGPRVVRLAVWMTHRGGPTMLVTDQPVIDKDDAAEVTREIATRYGLAPEQVEFHAPRCCD